VTNWLVLIQIKGSAAIRYRSHGRTNVLGRAHHVDAGGTTAVAAPAEPGQRHVATRAGNQRLDVRIPLVAAGPAREHNPDVTRLPR
jgi:hypothetical protein